jgi:hypothetical protein
MATAGYALDYGRIDIDMLEPSRRSERKAGEDNILAGNLLNLQADGDVIKHATDGGRASALIAGIDSLRGRGLSETDYDTGDTVFVHEPKSGDKVSVLLADGENVDPTDFLCSNGDGTLRACAVAADEALCRPADVLDLSAAGANHLLVVEWL